MVTREGGGEDWSGRLELAAVSFYIQSGLRTRPYCTALGIYRVDKEQGPAVQRWELYLVCCDRPHGKLKASYIKLNI